uniref:Uncharacterized protein n=1 Tax=Heterosigma akashiwo TaxID=2829 RepID=A0A7S4DGZ9_HETAK
MLFLCSSLQLLRRVINMPKAGLTLLVPAISLLPLWALLSRRRQYFIKPSVRAGTAFSSFRNWLVNNRGMFLALSLFSPMVWAIFCFVLPIKITFLMQFHFIL